MESAEVALFTAMLAAGVVMVVPAWVVLVGAIPVCMVLSRSAIVPPLLAIGDADVEFHDLFAAVILLRLVGRAIVTRRARGVRELRRRLGGPVIAFFGFLGLGIGAAGVRSGGDVFVAELLPFLRLVGQAAAGLALAQAVRSSEELRKSWRLLQWMGYLAAAWVVGSAALWTVGGGVGGSRETGDVARWFGPVGDEVGFVLVLFVVAEIAARRWVLAGAMVGAVFLTGTRGALIVLVVAAGAMWVDAHGLSRVLRRRVGLGLVVCVAGFGAVWWLDPGGSSRRFTEATLLEEGLAQRIETMWTAVRMIGDSPVTGVGFQGFRLLRDQYDDADARLTPTGVVASNAANEYLQTAADGGLLALAAFVWLGWRSLRVVGSERAGPGRLYTLPATAWLWALFLGAQTIAWLVPGSMVGQVFWVVLGLAVAGCALRGETRGGRTSLLAAAQPAGGPAWR